MNELTVKKPTELKLNEAGVPIINNLGEQLMYAETLIRTKMLPKTYTGANQVVAGLQMASELGLKPGIMTLRRTTVINGTPSIFAELPLGVCLASGLVEDHTGFYFDKDLKEISFENKNIDKEIFGYLFKIKRKGNEWHSEYYTLAQAKKASLGNVWNKHPEDMLKWRTIGKCLKTKFPDILSGTSVAEYDFNTMPTVDGNVTANIGGPQESDLNERFEETEVVAKTGEIIDDAIIVEQPEKNDTIEVELPANEEEKYEPTSVEEAMMQESKEKESSKEMKAKVATRQKAEVEAEKATERFDKEVAKTKSNVDWDKVSSEIKAEIQQEKEAAAAKKLAEEIPWEEEGTKVKQATAGDYVIPSGSHGGRALSSFTPKELGDYQKILREHLSKKPDSVDAKAVYRAIATYWAEEGVM